MESANPATSKCSSCKTWKPAMSEFFTIKLGKCLGTCCVCSQKKADKRKKAAEATKSEESYPADDDNTSEDLSDLSCFTLEEYLTIITMDETAQSFSVLVDVEILHLKRWSLVDTIALEVRGLGHDLEDLVKDIENYRNANRDRQTTWAMSGDRHECRRRENTMGFVFK
ncbi:hypothetical protein B0H13DRAFT_2373193 [Mycena leptocephala]|nr:hypothetical protein B0H13DRAFT_2373193 [Mycena leptocephala]